MKNQTTTSNNNIQFTIELIEKKIKSLSEFHSELMNKKKLTTSQLEIVSHYEGQIEALQNVITLLELINIK